jgi:hypothetical protein
MGVKKEKRRQLFNATEIKHYHSPFVSKSLGVPKRIPFDTAQDKLAPVIPIKIGMSLAGKKRP